MGKIQAPVIMNEAPASDEYGIVVRQVGGSGSAVDATIVAPLPVPVTIEGPLGSRPSAESVSVALTSDQIPLPVTGPLTDAEFRAVQTVTGNIAGNGQSVTLELNGAKSASVRFISNSFSGTVRFYTSNDGTNFDQCQGLRPFPFDVVNFKTPAWNGDSSTWVFCLNGGETHVRITSVSYTSGDVDILLVATEAPTSAILNAMANAGDTNQPLGALAIAGTRDTGLYPVSARSADPPSSDIGLVVRNISGLAQNGNPVNGDSVYIHKIAGYDERAGTAQLARVLDEAPLDNDFGVVTRNIPSGIQEVSGTVSVNEPVTVDGPLTDTELRASAIPTKETRSSTATTSQVADTNSSTTLLSANANRLGASIQNDSSAVLYLKCGTTASATDYTVRIVQYGYYEVPFGYTGRIDGIWATDPGDGAARITEFT